ncbi:hypothetical protein EGW08_019061 [Elysia chlorotica]|uniref:PKD/REJ-like domain-containing protein n=1 Tax=Elysia chlorotica TaxID=188477 RepID=A0A433SV97_ELYCH|nr:hypothetical protein EGW08_019061 [Elysia chlorotica]
MYELIEGFQVVEANSKVKAFEQKLLNISFTRVGTDTCVYVDYGDGSKFIYSDSMIECTELAFSTVAASNRLPLTGLTQLSHSYSSDRLYDVIVTAKNAHSSFTVSVSFSITGLDCSKPSVSISEGSTVFTSPVTFKKSDIIRVRGLSVISCADNYQNTKSWRAEMIDPQTNTATGTVSLADVDTTKAELNLPSRFLDTGLYKVYYKMVMDEALGSVKFEAEAFTYIQVSQSALIGVMLRGGVSTVERGSGQTLTLAPLDFSTDPDVDSTVAQGITVSGWLCHEAGDKTTDCSALGFDHTNTPSSQSLSVPGPSVGKTYQITATLTKDSRTVETMVFLNVVSGTPPFIYIMPAVGSVYYQQSDGFKVLQSSRLALDCICENCNPTDSMAYLWEVYSSDYRWPDGWRLLSAEDMVDRVFGIDGEKSKQISIQDNLFEVFDSTLMKVECKLTTSSGSGTVSTRLEVNKPPVPGTCTVSPTERQITDEAAWTITVDGWTDVDRIEEYQFFSHTDDDTVDRQITSIETSSGSFKQAVKLSEGPEYLQYQQEIIVKVRDSLQATKTFSCGTIKVTPLPQTEIRALAKEITTNGLHTLKRIFAEGDQKTCSETSTNIVSLLNSDSKRTRSEYAGQKVASNFANSMYGAIDANRPSYMQTNPELYQAEVEHTMETERNDRAAVRKQLIADMSLLEANSVVAIQQVSSFFAEAVLYGDEIDQDSQLTVMDSLGNMTLLLTNPPEDVPSEYLEVAMENGVAAIGGIMDAAGNNGLQGTLSELEAATTDADWGEYDTDMDSSAENEELNAAADFAEALKIHTALVHKKRQAKTAELVRKKVSQALDMQAMSFSRYSVPGQTLVMNTRKMKMKMEKTDAKTLQGGTLTPPNSNGGEVVLPNTTLFSSMAADSPVVVTIAQATNHPLKYSTIAQGIAPESNFIMINLYDEQNSKMSVKNLP